MLKKDLNPSSYRLSKKSGFSLIELSIVLIILGLLVAGVTGGATLIRSAKLRAVSTEANTWKSSVAVFATKYNGYPGDFNNNLPVSATASASFNSNNGGPANKPQTQNIVGTRYFPNQNRVIQAENCEGLVAFVDLANVGASSFIPYLPGNVAISTTSPNCTTASDFNLIAADGSSVSGSLAPSKFDNAGWAFDGVAGAGSANIQSLTSAAAPAKTVITNQSKNYVILTGRVPARAPAAAMSATDSIIKTTAAAAPVPRALGSIKPDDAQEIDLKIDDGRPSSGNVLGITGVSPDYAYGTAGRWCQNVGPNPFPVIYNANSNTDSTVCLLAFSVDIL